MMDTFKGYIQIYTGNGKGKTTAALGLALRAAGNGKKIYIAQFMKKSVYSEITAIEKYLPEAITIEQFGLPDFHYANKGVSEKETTAAMAGIDAVNQAMATNCYDIIILEEANMVAHFKILPLEPFLDIMNRKPPHVEMILTGRNAPTEFINRADLVTEMNEIKHYYNQKIPARPGIEY